MSIHNGEEEFRLTQELAKLEREMKALDDRDDFLMQRAYENPHEAGDRMLKHRDQFGEHDLYVALRERPELFGEYPQDRARFDDAFQARKQLPNNFGDYMKRRDDADQIQYTLNKMKQEREQQAPQREDDLFPKR